MAIPKGITRQDVTGAIRDFDAGVPHPYRPSTGYDLVYGRRRYPPKAIVGLAARRLNGGLPLDPIAQFSGGDSRSAANRVLRELGFVVVPKGASPPSAAPTPAGRDWSGSEIDRVVVAYLGLLRAELAGEHPVKRELTRALEAALPGRGRRSIEYKLQNISAALYEQGLPWVDGYKPLSNYQHALKEALIAALDGAGGLRHEIESAAENVPDEIPPVESYADREVPAPNLAPPRAGTRHGPARLSTWPGALRDEANRRLGSKGEAWVCELERERLASVGRHDLVDQVEWVATTRGDGLGYDVLSFTPGGEELWIEVKTTNAGASTPFLLTRNELDVWQTSPGRYRICRVFQFSSGPRFYQLNGPPGGRVALTTVLWEARPVEPVVNA